MSRIARIAVAVTALLSLFGVVSSSASAATWHNSGSTTVHATAGSVTFSSTSAGLACPAGGTMSGTVSATPAVVPVGKWLAMTGTTTWTGCTLGVSGYTVDCPWTFTADSLEQGQPAITHGTKDFTCGVYLAGTKFCDFHGTIETHYVNPESDVSPGYFVDTTGGTWKPTNTSTGTCPLGNGDLGHASVTTFTLTSAAGSPILNRTA